MDVLFLLSIFRLYPGLNLSFEHDKTRKNLFLRAGFCLDSRLALGEMYQKYKFGETIGYADSNLEFFIRLFNLFRLHVILRDAAGAVRAHSGKGLGYCYMIRRELRWCLLGHVIRLLFCLPVKLFLPTIFKSVDFCSNKSCNVLDIELADINVIEDLGVFIHGNVQGLSFCFPKNYKPTKQAVCCTKNLARNCVEHWTFGLQWAPQHSF